MSHYRWDYDEEHDILFLSDERKRSHESIELQESIVLDLDRQGKLAAIELFDASELLSALGSSPIDQQFLRSVEEVSVSLRRWRNFLVIELVMHGAHTVREKFAIPASEPLSSVLGAV